MSGHSKWANIKRQKQATDVVRGQVFTKLANAITVIVKESGGVVDPDSNFRLRLVIEKAKQVNMPKANIERAIDRATGKTAGEADLAEVVYEGFAPHGVAVIAEGVTNNKQRTAATLKNVFTNHGGNLSGVGSVAYLFKKIGEIHLAKTLSYDAVLEMALGVAADDLEEEKDRFIVVCQPQILHKVKEFFNQQNMQIIESELTYKPVTTVEIFDAEAASVIKLLTALEELEDIHKVHANFIIKN